MSLSEFSNKFLYREPYASPNTAGQFRQLITWQMIEEIFTSGHADCWLPKNGFLPKEPHLNNGRLDLSLAITAFQNGRTVLVRHAEKGHPLLSEISRDFFNIFQVPIDIQIYLTPPGEEGFNWHYDAEDVFVIQTSGQKEFRIKKNTIHSRPSSPHLPKDLEFEKEPPAPEIRCLLQAGDCLYIPAGWWHKAKALTSSAHISVGAMLLDQRPPLMATPGLA